MANKSWSPPLLCPIPRGAEGHYATRSFGNIYHLLKSRHRRSIYQVDESGEQFADLTTWGYKSQFNRLFVRRSPGANVKSYKKSPPHYAIINAEGRHIRDFKTKKSAVSALQKNSITYRRHGKILRDVITPGWSVVKIPKDIDIWDYLEVIPELLPVASKKCKSCPNTSSPRGQCACQFWASLRDGVQKHHFYTPHEVKHKNKQDSKHKQEMNEDAILLYQIRIKSKK